MSSAQVYTALLLCYYTRGTQGGPSFEKPRKDSEKSMAPHSSILAWQIPWMEEPGGLQPMRSLGVGHD